MTPPRNPRRLVAALAVGLTVVAGATACESTAKQSYEQRVKEQKTSPITGESLEARNLKEKLTRENDPNRVGYVYLVNFGKPFGYYTIKGKVSSSGSQLGPEQEVVCPWSTGESCQPVDSKQDDGTYGQGDPGIFFFTAEGTRVETTLDYIYSDQPLAIDVPRLDPKGNA